LGPFGRWILQSTRKWSWGYLRRVERAFNRASNNQAKYEAMIVGMLLAKELGARSLLVKSDSLLVTGQITGKYQAKEPQLASYLWYV